MIKVLRSTKTLLAAISIAVGFHGVSAADITPAVQGHYSRTIENYPKPENQYPEGDSQHSLLTGNIGEQPVNLSIVLKYDIGSVPKLFKKALIELLPIYTNPNPANPGSEGAIEPPADHFYVVEVFSSENSGQIVFDDVLSDDVKRVGPVMTVPKELNPHSPESQTVDITWPLQAAKQAGWKSLAFRIVETDSKGEPLQLPAKTMFGIQFRADPVLQVE
jgi:hypothetical protein